MASTIEVESVSGGYRWTLLRGMSVHQDNKGNTFYDTPEEIYGGWEVSEGEARSNAQTFAESL